MLYSGIHPNNVDVADKKNETQSAALAVEYKPSYSQGGFGRCVGAYVVANGNRLLFSFVAVSSSHTMTRRSNGCGGHKFSQNLQNVFGVNN